MCVCVCVLYFLYSLLSLNLNLLCDPMTKLFLGNSKMAWCIFGGRLRRISVIFPSEHTLPSVYADKSSSELSLVHQLNWIVHFIRYITNRSRLCDVLLHFHAPGYTTLLITMVKMGWSLSESEEKLLSSELCHHLYFLMLHWCALEKLTAAICVSPQTNTGAEMMNPMCCQSFQPSPSVSCAFYCTVKG